MAKLVTLKEEQLRHFRQLAVIGDIHGDFETLQTILKTYNPAKDGIIFLGDYADRGLCGVEVIETVDSLLKDYPRNVFALKGNHEDYNETGDADWGPCDLPYEVDAKGGDWCSYFQNSLKPFFERLPLALIIPDDTLFVHGGVTRKIRRLRDLKYPIRDIEWDILWADPYEGRGELPNLERRTSIMFGADVTDYMCDLLGVKRIVRSHQPSKALAGPFYSHNRRVITTSSTRVYGGKPLVLIIDPADSSRPRPMGWNFLC